MAETGSPKQNPRLLLMIARSLSVLDDLMTGMLDVGITGATVIESKGLGAILREDMPMFAGLAALLPEHTGSRVVISLTAPRQIEKLNAYIEEMKPEDQPICIVLPIEQCWGPIRLS